MTILDIIKKDYPNALQQWIDAGAIDYKIYAPVSLDDKAEILISLTMPKGTDDFELLLNI